MKPTNLISAFQGVQAYYETRESKDNVYLPYQMKNEEAVILGELYNHLKEYDSKFDIYDGYYIGYTISQISKEFDLLRFCKDMIVNIELKQELNLSEEDKIKKVLKQQSQNYHYLKALEKDIYICTYVDKDGLYEYDRKSGKTEKIPYERLVDILKKHELDLDADPDKLFIPSNYLVSPFNSTEKFLRREYFLTGAQETIKNELTEKITSNYVMYAITAGAGTGKTLLLYDIARTISEKNKILIIHCGKLNAGHEELINRKKWNICSIKDISETTINKHIEKTIAAIFIDESQRIRTEQLKIIINKSKKLQIPIVFSYDIKQYLNENEKLDVYKYVKSHYPEINIYRKSLTNKIRTNDNLSSFITNLMDIGKSNSHLDYSKVSIDYFDDVDKVKDYVSYLKRDMGWKCITYTCSRYTKYDIDRIGSLSLVKAHDVIGQEFQKVVFVMDYNFQYSEENVLQCSKKSFYSLSGMFYQIITRVIDEMKIIVLENKQLYYKLLQIKALEKTMNKNSSLDDTLENCE